MTKPNDEAGALGGTDLTDDGEIPDGMCNLVSAFTRGSGSGSVESRYMPFGFACLKCVLCYSASGLRLGSQGEKMDEKMWPRGGRLMNFNKTRFHRLNSALDNAPHPAFVLL